MQVVRPRRYSNNIVPIYFDYMNFQGTFRPHIGVYYIFPNFLDKGLCRELKLDIKRLLHEGRRVIISQNSYEFRSESWLLSYHEKHRFQAIKTKLPDRVSFRDLTFVVADAHFTQFLKANDWLSNIRLQ